ncbi:MAG TPA: class I adenylate-forming enzyme family protein [Desulfobacteraceae bacterium]|nr:class I adenylate-forming enzyme family protein [Desulfobacteraceae bacterium]HPJ66545.1 class I adenylate-forming enzyme family protein [Desulfobacteraceae bacterium]HPQ27489.1 class I adenylate-forming enzyme family protein [Desulfobacteraceae bacterium]
MIISEILARNARMYGDEIALIEREPAKNKRVVITWKEFDDLANRIANALIKKGVKKGDKVIHLMMNCIEWLPAYFGILRTGAWAVPLNFRFTAEDIQKCAKIAEGKVMIFGEEFIDRINSIKSSLDETITDYVFLGPANLKPDYAEPYEDFVMTGSTEDPNIPVSITDEAGLYFTSGTTGTPKPILLTQRNLEAACIIENRHHNQTHEDNFVCIPPLYHTGAKMHWFGNFIVGAKAVILKGVSPKWILEAVSEEKATIVWVLVPWAQDILIAIENGDVNLDDYELDQWRLMHIGAQPVPPSLIKNWKKVFPNHDYDTNYGLSESTGPGCVHLGIENLHKVGAIGVPGFDWEFKIVDEELKTVAKGQPGELMVKGPGVMKEYYKNPEATEKSLFDGWLLTGDMARVDEDGFIWLVDRKKDVIISGGENIFPVEVEDALMENSKIQDAAVIGIPDERLGEIAVAVVQLKPGQEMTEDEFFASCEAIPRYKRPRKVFFEDVPRNPTGKIEKPKLREKFSGMAESFKL